MAKNKPSIHNREIDPQEFYLNSIKNITGKMTPADYYYLSDKIMDISNRLEAIKNR